MIVKRPLAIALLFAVTIGVPLSAKINVHLIREHETASQLLWSQRAAYVVTGLRRDGWTGNYLTYGLYFLRGLFGGGIPFQSSRHWQLVTHIAPSGIDRHELEGQQFTPVQPFGEDIFQQFAGGKWNGSRFVPLSGPEASEFENRKIHREPLYTDIGGWSSRINLLKQGDGRFEYPLLFDGAKAMVIAERHGAAVNRIHAVLPGQTSVEIVFVDERLHRVGAEEFRRLMEGAQPIH